MNQHLMTLVAVISSAASILIAVFIAPPGNGYRVAPVFLVPLIWIVWALRRRLHLTPFTFAAFMAAVLFHNYGGARGAYQTKPFGINFDVFVHSYFGFVGGLLIHRFVDRSLPALSLKALAGATILLVMGFGALHELMEYGSTLVLGEERGMLKSEKVAPFDTQRDLTSNLGGVIVATLLMTVISSRRKPSNLEDPAVLPVRPTA
jgi:uncharacterized membrane protein YjdF